jgi:hypothetical protein
VEVMLSKYRFRNVEVSAISEEILPEVLRKLELYEDVVNGHVKCYICGRRLTLDTIGAIAMIDRRPVLICSKPSCIGRASLIIKRQASKPL